MPHSKRVAATIHSTLATAQKPHNNITAITFSNPPLAILETSLFLQKKAVEIIKYLP